MGVLDVIVIVILLMCFGYGLYSGFIKIFFSVASVIVGSIVAGKFYVYGSKFLPQNNWTLLFSFAIIFFVVSFIIMILGKFMATVFEKMLLKPIDKIFGAVFLLIIGALVIGIINNGILNLSPDTIAKSNIKNAKVVQYVFKFDKKFFSMLPKPFQEKLENISPKKIGKQVESKVEELIA